MDWKRGRQIRFAIVLAFVAVIAGCSLPVNEQPPPQLSPETKLGEQTQCLANVLPIMRGFMEGSASPDDVGGTWDCLGMRLRSFKSPPEAPMKTALQLARWLIFLSAIF